MTGEELIEIFVVYIVFVFLIYISASEDKILIEHKKSTNIYVGHWRLYIYASPPKL